MSILRVDLATPSAGGIAVDIISGMAKSLIDFGAESFSPPVFITKSTNVSSITDVTGGEIWFDHINVFEMPDYATTSVSVETNASSNVNGGTASCFFRGTYQVRVNTGDNNADTMFYKLTNTVTALGELADA